MIPVVMNVSAHREHWGSRIGFIFATMGSAVGLGNVWRFPTVVVRNGGGAFVLLYLLIILAIGVPTMIAELVLGKKTQRNVVSAFGQIKPGSRWGLVGLLSMAASFVVLSFYAVIAGWTAIYLLGSLSGHLITGDASALKVLFSRVSSHGILSVTGQATFLLFTVIVVVAGVTGGIERVNSVLMPGIVVILTVLLVRTLLLPGAIPGVFWFLRPDVSQLSLKVALDALGQVFFSFSLGMGAIVTYGSYLPRDHYIPGSALWIAGSDLAVALLAGLTVIPALFAFGIPPEGGPGLIFVTLPAIFSTLPFSMIWASLFFTMLLFAALSSSVSMLEVVVSYLVDVHRFTRVKAAFVSGIAVFFLGIPSALSTGRLSGFLIFGRTFFDLVDFIASNVFLPVAGFFTAVFVAWVWGVDRALAELEIGQRFTWGKAWALAMKYLVPLAVLYVFVRGLLG